MEKVAEMTIARLDHCAALDQSLKRVVANRLQHPKARFALLGVNRHEGLVRDVRQSVEDARVFRRLVALGRRSN